MGPDMLSKRKPSAFVIAMQHLREERDGLKKERNLLREENITLQNKVNELESRLRHRGRGTW